MDDSPQPSKRTRLLILFSVLFVIIVAVGAIAFPKIQQQWTQPLGPGLELPTYTPTAPQASATEVPVIQVSEVDNPTDTITPSETIEPSPTVSPTPTPEPLCGGPPVMYLLGVGADNRNNNYLYGLADVIRIARVDFVTPKITVLSIPRDLWVEIPGISDHYDITHGKLNQSYLYGGLGMGYYDEPGEGPGLLARTLDLNYGLRVDHYGAVNMQTFVDIVDALGGIDIVLPTDVDGRPKDGKAENMGYFVAGEHHFRGSDALRFSRIRNKYNDFERMNFQTMVLCSVRDKLLSPSVLPKIPQIVASFRGSTLTDLSPQQISQLVCLLPNVNNENLLFTSLPEEILQAGSIYSPQQNDYTFALQVDNAVIRDYIERFQAGTWPDKPKEPTCP